MIKKEVEAKFKVLSKKVHDKEKITARYTREREQKENAQREKGDKKRKRLADKARERMAKENKTALFEQHEQLLDRLMKARGCMKM